jgi:hypothetical protein
VHAISVGGEEIRHSTLQSQIGCERAAAQARICEWACDAPCRKPSLNGLPFIGVTVHLSSKRKRFELKPCARHAKKKTHGCDRISHYFLRDRAYEVLWYFPVTSWSISRGMRHFVRYLVFS